MKVGVGDLRTQVAKVLEEVRRGYDVTVTYRNVPVAVIKPVKRRKLKRHFKPIGFGMWAGRKDLKDVAGWVRKMRQPRYVR